MPKNKNTLTITCSNVVICDDVRREDNGKVILIGVYTGEIVVTEFPHAMDLTCWFEIASRGDGKAPFSARALFEPDGIELFSVSAGIERERGPLGEEVTEDYFAAPCGQVQIERPGTIVVQFKSGESDWQTVRSKNVASAAAIMERAAPKQTNATANAARKKKN
ncbi:DUF6941 family protein [Maricaulis sp.]|uniref:DUF6941 family protein n=1 Tax=Maricaulis sp. TaxID=1486257 RepID=UPI003A91D112